MKHRTVLIAALLIVFGFTIQAESVKDSVASPVTIEMPSVDHSNDVTLETLVTLKPLGTMATLVGPGEEVTSSGTSAVELKLKHLGNQWTTVYVSVDPDNTGTIQFAIGESPGASQRAWVADEKFPISVRNGVLNLWYKASASSNSFTVTY